MALEVIFNSKHVLNCIIPVGKSKILPVLFVVYSINGGFESYFIFTSITVKYGKQTLEPICV
jgi:hypothetical protein